MQHILIFLRHSSSRFIFSLPNLITIFMKQTLCMSISSGHCIMWVSIFFQQAARSLAHWAFLLGSCSCYHIIEAWQRLFLISQHSLKNFWASWSLASWSCMHFFCSGVHFIPSFSIYGAFSIMHLSQSILCWSIIGGHFIMWSLMHIIFIFKQHFKHSLISAFFSAHIFL